MMRLCHPLQAFLFFDFLPFFFFINVVQCFLTAHLQSSLYMCLISLDLSLSDTKLWCPNTVL